MTDKEALVKQRGGYKGVITRISNWYNDKHSTEVDDLQFEIRLEALTQAFSKYSQVQEEIEKFDPYDNDRENLENDFYNLSANLKGKIRTLIGTRNAGSQNLTPVISQSMNQGPNVNLPLLNIPQFNGDVTKWNAFFQMYDTLIFDNNSLSNVQKLIYLKSYLSNEPLKLVDTLPLLSGNLQIAIDTLKNRYDNQLSIIFAHIKNLVDIPTLTKVSAQTLREFIVQIKQNFDSLKNQNIPVDQWDLILIYIFSHKLDLGTRKAYITERGSKMGSKGQPKLDDFLNFLERRCLVLEDLSEPILNKPPFQGQGLQNNNHHHSKYRHTYHANAQSNHEMFSQSQHVNNTNPSKYGQNTSFVPRNSPRPSSPKFNTCSFCNLSNHRIYTCIKFKALPIQQKSEFVSKNALCFNCLGTKHRVKDCNSQQCSKCGKRHHSLLHPGQAHFSQQFRNSNVNPNNNENPLQSHSSVNRNFRPVENSGFESTRLENRNSNPSENRNSNNSSQNVPNGNNCQTLSVFASDDNEVLLATAMIKILDFDGNFIDARAIIDPGSTISIITESLLKKLNLNPHFQNVQISGIGGNVKYSEKSVTLEIHSNVNADFSLKVNCCVLDKITGNSPQFKINRKKLNIPFDVELSDPNFETQSFIDILLGADIYYSILSGDLRKISHQSLTLVGTHFGYLLAGLIPPYALFKTIGSSHSKKNDCFFVQNSLVEPSVEPTLDSLLEKFSFVEDISPVKGTLLHSDDMLVEENFLNTTVLLENGSYQIDLPFRTPKEDFPLGESFFLAKKRFLHLENRFNKHPQLFEDYKKFIKEYVVLNHARVIPISLKSSDGDNKYFLPHHCVIKEESKTTKLRVVFDGSMKTTSGLSLNDTLNKGYTVQPDLFDILLRFRSYEFVLTSDIEKMYRQVRVNPKHTHLQNILWRENPADKLQCIELLTITYGTNCAPFLATRVLNQLALTHINKCPLASNALLTQCYVDDILCGQDSLEKLSELYNQLISLCELGNFKLHKWCSNSDTLLKEINPSKILSSTQEMYDIKVDGLSNKVLGIYWNPNSDVFSICLPDVKIVSSITKREVLSIIAQMFDPLGLIGPIIVSGKIIMQEVWKSQIGWDDPLDDVIFKLWTSYFSRIHILKFLEIPRFYFTSNQILFFELHGFSDASKRAYGACVYIRAFYVDNSVTCNLITSKSRIAPIKELTIPRLELCGALLLSNLITRVIQIFKDRFSFRSINLWSDSEIVLAWIRSTPSKYNVFVANRISQIQTLTANFKWRHVKSADNPADGLSRGLKPENILEFPLWWHGPQFLTDPDTHLDKFYIDPMVTNDEVKGKVVLLASKTNDWQLFFNKFSSYTRLQRTMAFILRFVNNSKKNSLKCIGSVSVEEYKNAEIVILKILQGEHFSKEFLEISSPIQSVSNKQIRKLNPFIDSDGLLKVGGRLSHAQISYNHKHPVLLPSKNYVVSLLLKREHIRLGHAGSQCVLSNIRLRYWPLDGLREIKRITINCHVCHKFKAKSCQQIMADLPKDRIIPSRPFSKTGVDFAGPVFIKSSTLRRFIVEKAYFAIFVCMATKAVHIELVSNLSTPAFLACLKRFVSRRGYPSVIYSDNGSNFLGARNQLKELYDFFKRKEVKEKIKNFLLVNETQWKFIPPLSPHWGGIWEAAVKSVKHHVRRTIGDQKLTFEEFATILAQIEAILNSRPLCPISSDPLDLNCLTPGHFLIGEALTAFPDQEISDIPENRLSRWQRCTKIHQNFWKRWTKEYLNQLQNRPKWFTLKKNLSINDVVLLKEDNTKPFCWPLARIVEIFPGKDDQIRSVKVRTKDGIFVRNITKLCPLPNHND